MKRSNAPWSEEDVRAAVRQPGWELAPHAIERFTEREVPLEAMNSALRNPVSVVPMGSTRALFKDAATCVVVDYVDRVMITVYPNSSKSDARVVDDAMLRRLANAKGWRIGEAS